MSEANRLGILGGGQLAALMCEAARDLGVHTLVVSPDPKAVARPYCDTLISAALDDPDALRQLAAEADVVTVDHEHVPLPALQELEAHVVLHPGLAIMRQISDRLLQRQLLSRLDLPQTRYWSVDSDAALQAAQREGVFPAVLKTRRGGYDGLGQQRVASAAELPAAWETLKRRASVLEAWLTDVSEFSLVGARGADGEVRIYPPIENHHQQGQLRTSSLPCAIGETPRQAGEAAWRAITAELAHVGVLTVEFFVNDQGHIWINEIAPRVHNSGHLTQFAYACSQFELHVRAVTGRILPALGQGRSAVMLNLYPEHGITDAAAAERLAAGVGGQLIWYDKTPRPRRKMGHWLLPPEKAAAARAAIEG